MEKFKICSIIADKATSLREDMRKQAEIWRRVDEDYVES
jgi:hypothetical protein